MEPEGSSRRCSLGSEQASVTSRHFRSSPCSVRSNGKLQRWYGSCFFKWPVCEHAPLASRCSVLALVASSGKLDSSPCLCSSTCLEVRNRASVNALVCVLELRVMRSGQCALSAVFPGSSRQANGHLITHSSKTLGLGQPLHRLWCGLLVTRCSWCGTSGR